MKSTTTISREKKIKFLKESLAYIIELLLMEKRQRDPIRLSRFRKVMNDIKELHEEAKIRKSKAEIST